MCCVQRCHFNHHVSDGRKLSVHNFKISERRKKRCACARFVLPAETLCKTHRLKKSRQPLVHGSVCDRAKGGDSLDHVLILSCCRLIFSPCRLPLRSEAERKRPAPGPAFRET